MDIVVLVRIAILTTFVLMLVIGPLTIILLRRMIGYYIVKHAELTTRIDRLETFHQEDDPP